MYDGLNVTTDAKRKSTKGSRRGHWSRREHPTKRTYHGGVYGIDTKGRGVRTGLMSTTIVRQYVSVHCMEVLLILVR